MLNRKKYIDEIIDRLGCISNVVSLRASMNLLDLNIHMESFMSGLLNLVYGYNLVNLNSSKTNYASIDLGDFSNRIAIQVTSDNNSTKIKKTIKTFFDKKYDEEFDRLIVLIVGDKKAYKTSFYVPDGFSFSKDSDIWDFQKLIRDISNKTTEALKEIVDFLKQELSPTTDYEQSSVLSIAESMKNKVYAQTLAKLESTGVSKEIAEKIIDSDIASDKYQYILDEALQGKHYLVGSFGSGKSHAVLILCQKLLKNYTEGTHDLLPLYTHVRDIVRDGSIQCWLKNLSISNNKYILFIDGLDEINYLDAAKIIEEVFYISSLSPQNILVICSRPLTYLPDQRNQINIRPLSIDEQKTLINIIADEAAQKFFPRTLSNELKSCVEIPLFCVIYALLKGTGTYGWVKNKIDLLTAFIEKATKHIVGNNYVYEDLIEISICAINMGYRDIHSSEVVLKGTIDSILKTGLLEKHGEYLSFPLIIVAQFLAAKALQLNMVEKTAVISSRSKIELWRYPLSIMFSQAPFEESFELFSEVFCIAPGLAAQIITDGTKTEKNLSLPPAEECGRRIVKCINAWNKALGPLSSYVSPSTDSFPQTLGVCTENNCLSYGWYRSLDNISVESLSIRNLLARGMVCTQTVAAQSTWPWIITFKDLSSALEKNIEERRILGNCPQLKKEYFWEIASILARKNSIIQQSIPIKEFDKLKNNVKDSFSISKKLIVDEAESISKEDFFYLLNEYAIPNSDYISPPFPSSDQNFSNGYVWSCYSQERYLELVNYVYRSALENYLMLVKYVFTNFCLDLPKYILSPCRIIGKLKFDPNASDDGAPSLNWYILALPESSVNEVNIEYGDFTSRGDRYDEIIDNRKKYRPQMKNYGIIESSEALFLNCCKPVTKTVYKWIATELKSLGWIKNYRLR